jgi:hypothetical protein
MKRSRRRFLKVVAAGAAAAMVAPSSALAETAKRIKSTSKPSSKPAPRPAPEAAPGGARASEVAKAKAGVEQTLRTLREYPLANGAEPAFGFRALKRARGGH